MSRHRAQPPRRHAAPPAGRRRADKAEPRYGRIAVLGASVSVTAIAMLGGIGVLPSVADGDSGDDGDTAHDSNAARLGAGRRRDHAVRAAVHRAINPVVPAGRSRRRQGQRPARRSSPRATDPRTTPRPETRPTQPAVPDDSGDGQRVVFNQSEQRVWLVDDDEERRADLPRLGQPLRQPRPRHLRGLLAVRGGLGLRRLREDEVLRPLHRGRHRVAIGFHDIPIDNGALVQTVAQLGTPQSHGCVRQDREDAIALWEFAPIGTEVAVTA